MARKFSGQAVVVGGSIAGLFAARVASDYFESVVVLERDDLVRTGENRHGVPQGKHGHALLDAGRARIERWFPGIDRELLDGGAVPMSFGTDMHWHQGGGLRVNVPDLPQLSVCSRVLLEETVRARLGQIGNIEIRTGVRAAGLAVTPDRSRITGVDLDDGTTVDAAFVVDCSGRAGRSVEWIDSLGYVPPEMIEVTINTRYTSRVYKVDADTAPDWLVAFAIDGPDTKRGGACFPLEGGRWMVTLAGFHGEHAEADDEAFHAYAESLCTPALAHIIKTCRPIGGFATHRLFSDQRRLTHKMKDAPIGWALLGDSVASFNPVYGQGMSSAAFQAEALEQTLAKAPGNEINAALSRRVRENVGKSVDNVWLLSTTGDFNYPQTTGKKARGTNLINRYMNRLIVAAQSDVTVAREFLIVGNLLKPGTAIFKPGIAWRVLLHGRRRAA